MCLCKQIQQVETSAEVDNYLVSAEWEDEI